MEFNDNLSLGGGIPNIGGPRIDPRDYPSIRCKKCGSIVFDNAIIIKEIPGTVVGKGSDPLVAPLQVYVCKKCGEILESDVKAYKLEKELGLDVKDEPKEEAKSSSLIL